MPAWGTLIALTRNGEPVFGMMHQPFIARALFRRRRRRALSRPGRRTRAAGAPLRGARRCGAVHHQPAADERGRPRAPSAEVEDGAPLALRRRLLRLLHARRRPRRPGDRDRAQAATTSSALIPIIDRRRRHHHHLEKAPRQRAAASSRPATSACMRPRLNFSTRRSSSRRHRRAGHERVERRPELAAITILLHQHFVPRARHDRGASRRAAARRNASIAGVETTESWPAATISIGWRILPG